MRILIITQTLDLSDPILGFFHEWVEVFSKKVHRLCVIALGVGNYSLDPNTTVMSLGKESHVSKIIYLFRFYRFIWTLRKDYDSVFVHMNQIYVLLGWPLWFVLRKKVYLWYVHKSTPMSLRLACLLSERIFTASKESLRIKTSKKEIVGHGINTKIFYPPVKFVESDKLITVGRVSPVKNIELLIRTVAYAQKTKPNLEFEIIGPFESQRDLKYKISLEGLISSIGAKSILFRGSITGKQLADKYRSSSIFLHSSQTGSIDKVVLEALACGLVVYSSSEAFANFPGVIPVPQDDIMSFADRLLSERPSVEDRREKAQMIYKEYSIERLIDKMVSIIQKNDR